MERQLWPKLGRIGVWSSGLGYAPAAQLRAAAVEAEALGYGAMWLSEGLVRDPFFDAAQALQATSTLTMATGIASIALRHPVAARGLASAVNEVHPGRFLLGLGTSDPGIVRAFFGLRMDKPFTAMREYLDGLDSVFEAIPLDIAVPPPVPRVLAALGPRMLELSRDRADGAHTYLVTPEHTAAARAVLGPDKLLAVEQAVAVDADPERARGWARAHVGGYLGHRTYKANWARLGYTEDDFADGGSDRLVDALVASGDVDTVRRRVAEHLAAGADHVCIQALGDGWREVPREQWRELAPALLTLSTDPGCAR